jgi:two-component system, NtrC family, response regulator HydG
MPTLGSPTSVPGQTIPTDVLSGNQVPSVPPGQVLLVDDDPAVLRLLEFELAEGEVSTVAASDGRQALDLLKKTDIDAIILDLALPDISGQELLKRFQAIYPDIPVIVLTARDEIDEAVACMQLGARDFVTKPFDRPRLITSVQNACNDRCAQAQLLQLAAERRRSTGFDTLIGRSAGMVKVKALLSRATNNDVTVLLEGESGTGKEVFARALHTESHRSRGAFVAVNCGAIPESLIESELFGHCEGAFTGAIADHCGFFEQAEGGTILLDEIGELPLTAQVRLLRVLQERQVQRIGDKAPRAVDVRIIAATNRCLADLVPQGGFRKDLFYRLAVFPITLPPLRERLGDIPLLAEVFLERISEHLGKNRFHLDQTAIQAMGQYDWPGNVRELENALERACLLAEGEIVTAAELPDPVLCTLLPDEPAAALDHLNLLDSQEIPTLAEEERRLILHALRVTHWNLSKAAQKLGIGRATIYRKIERYGLQRHAAPLPPAARRG